MAALTNIFHYVVPSNVLALLHFRQYRRITVRHVLFAVVVSVVLSALYYTRLKQSRPSYSSQESSSWPPETPEIWAKRAAHVKEAFRHAYHGYERHAFPHDELMPASNLSNDNFNGWGVTAVDSLDTMLLMGFEDEYARALSMIDRINFTLPSNNFVTFFETVIRYLGGFLSAYAITGNDLLRHKADELGSVLMPAFNTASGLPGSAVDTHIGKTIALDWNILAEMASYQMEYAYLGKITGKKEYLDRATLVTTTLYNANLVQSGGMYPIIWSLVSGMPSEERGPAQVTVGAYGDSGHEYTLKQFLLTARTDKRNLEMYLRFTSYVISSLLFLTPNRQLLYVTDAFPSQPSMNPSHDFEHLSCFLPGLLALGAHVLPLDRLDTLGIDFIALADDLSPADRLAHTNLAEFNLADLHLWAAEGIAQTCYLTYADQPSGLGPDVVRMDADPQTGGTRWMDALRGWKKEQGGIAEWWRSGFGFGRGQRWGDSALPPPPGVGDKNAWTSPLHDNLTVEELVPPTRRKSKTVNTYGRDYLVKGTAYYLRPETVESLYILWRTTGNVKWRHFGWHIFQAIERHAKTDSGYSSVEYVHTANPDLIDSMPSYFLAETLKYLYLLFLDKDPFPLDEWVFNTEGHPFPVFEWTTKEQKAYGMA